MIFFNYDLAQQNDHGIYMHHYQNHPLLWIKNGTKVKCVILPILKESFSKKYMIFKNMSQTDFEYIFREHMIELNIPDDDIK